MEGDIGCLTLVRDAAGHSGRRGWAGADGRHLLVFDLLLMFSRFRCPQTRPRHADVLGGDTHLTQHGTSSDDSRCVAVDTLTLAEIDGRTILTLLVQHTSKEHRDAHIESGMEAGLQDALDLLEQVAVSLR
jgi:hypothetical protein